MLCGFIGARAEWPPAARSVINQTEEGAEENRHQPSTPLLLLSPRSLQAPLPYGADGAVMPAPPTTAGRADGAVVPAPPTGRRGIG